MDTPASHLMWPRRTSADSHQIRHLPSYAASPLLRWSAARSAPSVRAPFVSRHLSCASWRISHPAEREHTIRTDHPLLTVFSTAKAFRGITAVQQENAIQSWRRLGS